MTCHFSCCASPRSILGWRSGPWNTVWRWIGLGGPWRRSLLWSACDGCSAERRHLTPRSAGCRHHPLELNQPAPRNRSAARGLLAPGWGRQELSDGLHHVFILYAFCLVAACSANMLPREKDVHLAGLVFKTKFMPLNKVMYLNVSFTLSNS